MLFAGFSVGLASTALGSRPWSDLVEIEQTGIAVAAATVAVTLLTSWLAFVRWYEDGELDAARLAIAAPGLIWASHSISSSAMIAHRVDPPTPSALRLSLGIVSSCIVALGLFRPEKPLIPSRLGALATAVAATVALAVTADHAFAGRPELRADVLQAGNAAALPIAWVALGLLALVQAWKVRRVVTAYLGVALLLLGIAQVVMPTELGVDGQLRTVAAGLVELGAATLLLVGCASSLRQSTLALRRRHEFDQFNAVLNADLLQAERLLQTRTAHDQRAALLSIEAVIKLLIGPEAVDPEARLRLSTAAIDELRRLQDNSPQRVEKDLLALVEPIVAMANASGAKVTMNVRPGLVVEVGREFADIVRNLISNAVHHGGNSPVLIDARRADYEFVELSVADRGPGILAARRFDLFEPGRSSGGGDHSGLGLHNARSMLRAMGGDLVLDRGYADGARFIASIPVGRSANEVRHA